MKYLIMLFGAITLVACSNLNANQNEVRREIVQQYDYQELSQSLLVGVAHQQDVSAIQEKLAALNAEDLAIALDTDAKRKAFWINIYNAYINIILSTQPELWENRNDFFGKDRFTIAGKKLSFDKVEHGIIRSSSVKLSGGFVEKPLVFDAFERKMNTEKVDPRVHFALNCGAVDCPPVHLLSPENIEEELDQMTKAYLNRWTEYDEKNNKVLTTSLTSWFRGDFGGLDGVVTFLKKYDAIPATANDPDIAFKDYNWTKKIGVFAEELNSANMPQ